MIDAATYNSLGCPFPPPLQPRPCLIVVCARHIPFVAPNVAMPRLMSRHAPELVAITCACKHLCVCVCCLLLHAALNKYVIICNKMHAKA